MALINKDFRFQEKRERHSFLRWAVFALASVVLGVVIAKTSSNTLTADKLPTFKQVKPSQDEIARLSFELTLPELQAKQKILDELSAWIVLVGKVTCPIKTLNDWTKFSPLSPGQRGMACQEDIPDIWSILILEIIDWRLPWVFRSYSHF